MLQSLLKLILFVFVLAHLAACGQTGALYLSDNKKKGPIFSSKQQTDKNSIEKKQDDTLLESHSPQLKVE